ncbi:anthranilate phosphoribosyltransferase [bacterium]|nr:anthranilate phosphoribosyltransferase [bacterium]
MNELLLKFVTHVESSQNLSASQMEEAMSFLLSGTEDAELIKRFLKALSAKKETADEILGAARFLRSKSQKITLQNPDVLDTCGTGGDGKNTFNISTATAFVLAGGGVRVAKHGNRAVSSNSGSSDVLKELGVNIDASPVIVARCIDNIGIGFLFAPQYHQTLKNVAPIRKELAQKTIFNILGPLLNPANAKKQVMGVYDARLLDIISKVLAQLGVTQGAVVHGSDGLDEVTLTGTTQIAFIKNGIITKETFDPQSVGYAPCQLDNLKGGGPAENAKRLRHVLKGHSEAIDHCVHLNAALGFMVAGLANNFKDGLLLAQGSISSGKAYQKLEALIEMTH